MHPKHHCCGPIMQICPLQHPQDLVFPHKGYKATPGASTGHLPPGLLQPDLGWTRSSCDKTIALYPEHCSAPCFQYTQIVPCDPPPLWPKLSSCCSSHFIQDEGTGLQGRQRNCTHLPPNSGQSMRPSTGTLLYCISRLADTTIAENKPRFLSIVMTLFCSGDSVVERATWTLCSMITIHVFYIYIEGI